VLNTGTAACTHSCIHCVFICYNSFSVVTTTTHYGPGFKLVGRKIFSLLHVGPEWPWTHPASCTMGRGKSPNMGRCIISYQEALRCLLKNVNDQEHEAVLCNHITNGQVLRTSLLSGHLCFGPLWNFCLSLNCDSWAVKVNYFSELVWCSVLC